MDIIYQMVVVGHSYGGAVVTGGVTEVAFQPTGPDVARELAAFHRAVEGL